MLLMIDNYDSFTYNLYQYLSELGADVVTVRNDKTTLEDIEAMSPQGIIISPGPSTPLEAGISNDVIRHFGPKLPVLGVCLDRSGNSWMISSGELPSARYPRIRLTGIRVPLILGLPRRTVGVLSMWSSQFAFMSMSFTLHITLGNASGTRNLSSA